MGRRATREFSDCLGHRLHAFTCRSILLYPLPAGLPPTSTRHTQQLPGVRLCWNLLVLWRENLVSSRKRRALEWSPQQHTPATAATTAAAAWAGEKDDAFSLVHQHWPEHWSDACWSKQRASGTRSAHATNLGKMETLRQPCGHFAGREVQHQQQRRQQVSPQTR